MSDSEDEYVRHLEAQLQETQGDAGGAFEGNVANIANADALIGSILRRDANLSTVLADNDKQLQALSEAFIDEHVARADEMVEWYNEVTACENEILTFETDIESFQTHLTDTAEGIVKMQQDTLHLMKQVENRKVVSQRLKMVYDALNECEEFCNNIVHAPTVDDQFMQDIRQLESKIAFLADNEELKSSAVYLEIHPKLQASAVRAGDKLHHYLLRKFYALAEEGTNVALGQQAMERQGQYSYSFLARYNPPIASDLANQYVRIVADVHSKNVKGLIKDLVDVTPFSSQCFEPVVRVELMNHLHQNNDSGVPGTSRKGGAGGGGDANVHSRTSSSTSRSVSLSWEQRMSKLKDTFHKKFEDRRESNFDDCVKVLMSISFEHQLYLDPVLAQQLKGTTSWLSRFAELMCRTVNLVIAESRFISHFFFNATSSGTVEEEEGMLRILCVHALQLLESGVTKEISELTDGGTLMGALRVTELAKNCASQTPDPLPLLILAGPFENVSNALHRRLNSVLQMHLKSITQANLVKLQPFKGSNGKTVVQRVESDPSFAKVLHQAHDITQSFAKSIGEVELLNELPLVGSRVSEQTNRHMFDDKLMSVQSSCVNEFRKLVHTLAARHESMLAVHVVTVINLTHVLLRWRQMLQQCLPKVPGSPGSPDSPAVDDNRITSLELPQSALSPVGFALQTAVKEEVMKLVHCDLETSQLHKWYTTIVKWRKQLGPGFEASMAMALNGSSGGGGGQAGEEEGLTHQDSELAGTEITEEEMVATATQFHRTWKEAMSAITARLVACFGARKAPSGTGDSPTAKEPSATTNDGLPNMTCQIVLQAYFQVLLDTNRVFLAISKAFFEDCSLLQAKIIGNVALTHAAAHELRNLS